MWFICDLYVCGVVITKDKLGEISDLNGSKRLSKKKRAELFPQIIEKAIDYNQITFLKTYFNGEKNVEEFKALAINDFFKN